MFKPLRLPHLLGSESCRRHHEKRSPHLQHQGKLMHFEVFASVVTF